MVVAYANVNQIPFRIESGPVVSLPDIDEQEGLEWVE